MTEPAEVNIHEAKTHLSRLVARAEEGEEIIISRAGKPAAKLVPIRRNQPRRFGVWEGQVVIHDDFDELPEEVAAAFRGERP
ncbi:MAG TPA: type II toxin-antitoxin system Phd/YefM family antitoxin [Mycobacteriales bacterium]|nr:type II toxin-antitoxin system Phd/YefM family antitoxin [Mycobacteriales bacterium]